MFRVLFFLATLNASPAVALIVPPGAIQGFVVPGYAPVGNGPYGTHVAAWHDTGLFLDVGDIVILEATGTAAESPTSAANGGWGPDGFPADCSGCIADIPASRYALVGKIGTSLGDEFVVGALATITAQESGTLFLGFNDNHYFDNSGAFFVSSVPEPSTFASLGFGLVLLAAWRRRAMRYI